MLMNGMVEKLDKDELGGKTEYRQKEEGLERRSSHGRDDVSPRGRLGELEAMTKKRGKEWEELERKQKIRGKMKEEIKNPDVERPRLQKEKRDRK